MEAAYAQALWTTIANGAEPQAAVRALHAQLQQSGRCALMPRIARALERLAAREHTRSAITLTVADRSHEHAAHKEALAALAQTGIEATHIATHVDHSLIGGWRIEGRERLIDASYKKQLLDMYRLTTA